MDGIYAYVAGLGAAPDDPVPNHALWVIVSYNGDGTWDILTIGSNEPGEELDDEGDAVREAEVRNPDPSPSGTYEMNPDGTFVFLSSAGEEVYDGLILTTEMIDGVPVATEYILFHREPEPETGGLRVGRGLRQRPR